MDATVTGKTAELIRNWVAAEKKLDRAEMALATAKQEYDVARDQLGCWLTPDDAAQSEYFNIWFGNGILCAWIVNYTADGRIYGVKWRKVPDGKQAQEMGI